MPVGHTIDEHPTFCRRRRWACHHNQSSLCDEFGRSRSDLGLAELFQASYIDHAGHTTWWPHFDKMVLFTLCPHYVMDMTLRVLIRFAPVFNRGF